MKNFILLFLTVIPMFLFNSCSNHCLQYDINNFTDNSISLEYYHNDSLHRKLTVKPKNAVIEDYICSGDGKTIKGYFGIDSIQLKSNDILRKTYYPTDEGKSIYNIRDANSWRVENKKKYFTKYVFEIKEKDLE